MILIKNDYGRNDDDDDEGEDEGDVTFPLPVRGNFYAHLSGVWIIY